jgi:hypothetical protein
MKRAVLKRAAGRRNVMREFVIKEISAVDRPAQGHARMTLMKRDDADPGEPFNKHAVAEAIAKKYIDPQDGARSFQSVLRENMDEKRYWEVESVVCPSIHALDCALKSIAADKYMNPDAKMAMMADSAAAFLNGIAEKMPEVEAALAKGFSDDGADELGKNTGDDDMSAAEKKQLEELQKANKELTAKVEELNKTLEAATAGSEDAKKAAELQTQIAELTKAAEEAKAALEKAEADAAEKAAELEVAKMSDDEKGYMESLDKEAKGKFMAMTAEERKKTMKKFVDDEEVLKVGDTSIRKSVVGSDVFAVMKAQQEDLAKQRERTDKAEADALQTKLEKRAESELEHFAGTAAEKAAVLGAVDKMDEAPREALKKMLELGQKLVKASYETLGFSSEELRDVHKKAEAFEKRVSEIKEAEKCSGTEAMEIARKRHPEEFEAYQSADSKSN